MLTRQERARIHAGMLAASSLAVAKQIPLRDALPAGLPTIARPSTLGDLPNLFPSSDMASRGARLSSAAVMYSVDKKSTSKVSQLLSSREQAKLTALHERRKVHGFDKDRSCSHCRLLLGTLYDEDKWQGFPPIAIVNHSARVDITFDPDTYISEAKIDNFQVLVPEDIAHLMLKLSHPLHWADPSDSLFQRADPVERDGKPLKLLNGAADARTEWLIRTQRGTPGKEDDTDVFIYEDVAWPINRDLSADSENIIRISKFNAAPEDKDRLTELSYDYSLERCVRTNFGTAWEPSGLDIDDGHYEGKITGLDAIQGMDPPAADDPRLKRRNLYEMQATAILGLKSLIAERKGREGQLKAGVPKSWDGWEAWDRDDDLLGGWEGKKEDDKVLPDAISPDEFLGAIRCLGHILESAWQRRFVLVTVGASKKLHFTLPENSPFALWQSLTYTAPAFLFMFLNTAVCQTPHALIQDSFR